MAIIEKGTTLENGFKLRNSVMIELLLTDEELGQLEGYRARTEKNLNISDYSLDSAVQYIVGEVMSGRGRYFDMDYAFKEVKND